MITGTITAKPQVFAAAVKWAAGYLDARPAVPVWAGLMLDAESGTLTVTSMNEYVSAVASLPYEGDGKGRAVVSGRLLKELVATFPDKPVEISGTDNADTLVLAAGRWKGTLPTFADEDYPQVPGAPEAIGTVEGEPFARVIAEAASATSKDADKATHWRSVYLTFGDADGMDKVSAYATDSLRAAAASVPFSPAAEGQSYGASALVLAAQMVDVAAGFIGPDEITVGLSASQISLASRTRSVVVRLMDAKEYPADLVSKLTAQEQPAHAVVRKADLHAPMKRAALVREKDGPISVGFSAGLITLAASADDLRRDGAEEIDADYSGAEIVLHLNPGYFGDALATAPGDTVDIALNPAGQGNGRPAPVVLTVAGTAWRHVLMPIKK